MYMSCGICGYAGRIEYDENKIQRCPHCGGPLYPIMPHARERKEHEWEQKAILKQK